MELFSIGSIYLCLTVTIKGIAYCGKRMNDTLGTKAQKDKKKEKENDFFPTLSPFQYFLVRSS